MTMKILKHWLIREALLHWRMRRNVINASLFFLMIMVLFPMGFEADPALAKKVLPGLFWIAALFAYFLSANVLFQHEYDDGVLTSWLLDSYPTHVRVRIKLMVYWLVYCLPLILFCFVVGTLFDLQMHEEFILMLGLACGTPTIAALSAFSSVFGIGYKQHGVFTALIVLPLTLPILVFGGGILVHAIEGISVRGNLAALLAIAILAFWGMPYAIASVIRVGVADVGR